MKYHLVDLNVKYYLQRFDAISPRSKEWKALRTLFFDKWHTLLSNNEFNYQMEHIERLCDDFYRLQLSLAKIFRYVAAHASSGYSATINR